MRKIKDYCKPPEVICITLFQDAYSYRIGYGILVMIGSIIDIIILSYLHKYSLISNNKQMKKNINLQSV